MSHPWLVKVLKNARRFDVDGGVHTYIYVRRKRPRAQWLVSV